MSAVTALRPLQPLAQALLALAHGRFQAGDGALGDFGRGDQLGDGGAQRLLVGLEQPKLLVEPHAIQNREQQQDRHQALDQKSVMRSSLRLHPIGGLVRLLEHGEGGVRFAQRLGDPHRDAVADPAHAPFGQA